MTTTLKTTILAAAMLAAGSLSAATITLDGSNLTIEDAWTIAEGKADVAIAPEALKKLDDSHKLVMASAAKGQASTASPWAWVEQGPEALYGGREALA